MGTEETKFTVTQVLSGIWPLAILAFGVALVLTPVVRWIAYRFKIVDRPDDLLKPHGRPIAYLGGLAVCAGLAARHNLLRHSVHAGFKVNERPGRSQPPEATSIFAQSRLLTDGVVSYGTHELPVAEVPALLAVCRQYLKDAAAELHGGGRITPRGEASS